MRKTGRIMVLVTIPLLLGMPAVHFTIPYILRYLPVKAANVLFALRQFFDGLFPDFYFSILPGLLLLGLALLFHEKLTVKDKKSWSVFDLIWVTIGIASAVLIFTAYGAGGDSIFYEIGYLFGFLDYVIPGFGGLSPELRTFSLWIALFVLIISFIFLYMAVSRAGRDKQKFGGLMIGILVSFTFAVFQSRVPVFAQLEEYSVSLLFAVNRNPGAEFDTATKMNYCPAPYDASGRQIDVRPLNPFGIRNDIVIIGISKETIEKVQGNWPLDWQHYADMADRFSNAKDSILLFDISFLDEKMIYGGNYCGIKFDCIPIKGQPRPRKQVDVLAESISSANNIVLADYPMETTDEARTSIVNYEARLKILRKKNRLKKIKNGHLARSWARLPQPPVVKIASAINGIGYANILKNPWGLNRKMPIVIRIIDEERREKPGYNPDIHDEFYPGIDLLIATSYFNVDPKKDIEVDWLQGVVKISNIPLKKIRKFDKVAFRFIEKDIMVKPNEKRTIEIPIDQYGLMNINFRGGRYCFKFHEILDVSRMSHEDVQNNFQNKIALVAMYYATGVGTAKDMHLSPYGDMAGIEHHAYALNTILNQDFARSVPDGINLLILLIIGLIMGLYQPRVATWMSFLLLFVLTLVFIAITSYVSFNQYSYIHIFPTVIIQQFVIAIGFIGFRALAEEENVKFIRNTFSKFVSQDVVNELLSNPDALELGGAKKEVTVFFSDVRGFTTISEQLGPEDLVKLLNEYLSVMTDLIIEYRGTIDKYMGDAIMAFWGAPVENDEHAYFTCVAAVAQLKALQKLQTEWSDRGIPVLDIGIGINSGQAVVGNMGSSHRMDYTLMGDTVNLGSRLEGITKIYSVRMVISEYTYERVKDRVHARELDLVRVKGKLKPVRIYELMGLKDDSDMEKLRRTYKKAAGS